MLVEPAVPVAALGDVVDGKVWVGVAGAAEVPEPVARSGAVDRGPMLWPAAPDWEPLLWAMAGSARATVKAVVKISGARIFHLLKI